MSTFDDMIDQYLGDLDSEMRQFRQGPVFARYVLTPHEDERDHIARALLGEEMEGAGELYVALVAVAQRRGALVVQIENPEALAAAKQDIIAIDPARTITERALYLAAALLLVDQGTATDSDRRGRHHARVQAAVYCLLRLLDFRYPATAWLLALEEASPFDVATSTMMVLRLVRPLIVDLIAATDGTIAGRPIPALGDPTVVRAALVRAARDWRAATDALSNSLEDYGAVGIPAEDSRALLEAGALLLALRQGKVQVARHLDALHVSSDDDGKAAAADGAGVGT